MGLNRYYPKIVIRLYLSISMSYKHIRKLVSWDYSKKSGNHLFMLDYLLKQPYWKWFAYGIGGNVLILQYYYHCYASPVLKTKMALSR